ncbi:MAG: glycosyltransferase [Lachnospiraceae bacterium]|nr:glycosyltransferase [Lachnospiraceae bacterium]
MAKYLFFKLKAVSYQSYLYFADSLAESLKRLGDTVLFFDSEKEPLENMERLTNESFDAIFDFNSALPKVTMDDDTYFLDHIDSPFYNIILDHPLYHHDSLKHKLKNMHVLCLDERHAKYIKDNYPHIKSVELFAMTGQTAAKTIPYKDRKYDVLFTGSYTSSNEILDALCKIPPFMQKITLDVIDIMKADASLQVHEALNTVLPEIEDSDIILEHYPLHVQGCFLADTFIRAYKREEVLKTLVKADISLTLCGNGWEKFKDVASKENVTILDEIPFSDTFSLMQNSKISVNIMPIFTHGTHDRVYSACLNSSVCVTDKSSILEKQFVDRQDICFADISRPTSFSDIISDLLLSEEKAVAISSNGFIYADKNHTWDSRANTLKSLIIQ